MRSFCFTRSVVVFALTALAFAVPRSTVKESVILPRGWTKHSSPSPDHVISLRIGLPQPNFPSLEEHLYQVSDPSHSRYGQHLSKETVEELIAPHPSSLDAINNWLATHGLEEEDLVRSPAKDWITIRIPVSLVEKMLETKYHVYKHEASGDYLVRTTSYSLPEHLHEHVDVIQPTTMFGRFSSDRSTVVWLEDDSQEPDAQGQITDATTGLTVDASCNTTITIKCLQEMYNATGYTPSANVNNSIGLTGYLGQYANFQDLQTFYADQRPDALNSSFTVVLINNGSNSQDPSQAGVEANLDTQFGYGLSYPVPGTFFSTGGSPPFKPDLITPTDTNEPYLDWLNYVLAQEKVPLVISTSYGDDEQTVPASYAIRACQGLAQLGARGVSLTFSSGDGGVGDGNLNATTQICYTNDGRNVTQFMPSFPTSCPYVTSVGATQHFPEVAVSRFYSGAGFSNYFTRPLYQERAVSAYLASLPPGLYNGLYNPYGRAYPDVSAQGDFFRVFLAGSPIKVGGTSASSPTFAAIVALLNDARLKAGKKPLGFLNPLFYSILAGDFNDVTVGHSGGCGTWGFNATKGWDAVTGLGTPNFGKFEEKLLAC